MAKTCCTPWGPETRNWIVSWMRGCTRVPTNAVRTTPTPDVSGASAVDALPIVIAAGAETADGKYAASPPNDAVSKYVPGADSTSSWTVALPVASVTPKPAVLPSATVTSFPERADVPPD